MKYILYSRCSFSFSFISNHLTPDGPSKIGWLDKGFIISSSTLYFSMTSNVVCETTFPAGKHIPGAGDGNCFVYPSNFDVEKDCLMVFIE
ncbi:putative A ORF P [Vaccinia virus Copenhagen]|uniref:Uncharacterized 9.9 kDa protein n=2 Tax=Vaccinia virus TaxID=10245 RepID=YVAP_VACCC|nr:RecName: Full=Uncharacterized 9.9 kDa protein [Vaccinia virus Copenhagen]AGJ91633.1 hypothetical protein VACV_TT9_211 [Vaccinia virus]AAA48170.1 putative A ORF P [Vaccinia virus Copenhagen]AGJ91903.1 hypothetical protein VACV_TT10_211 [Vaccinia virus]WDR17316.1 putative A ORF P [Vaccinia virus Copenhagen]WDR17524.1 putative A ORF P [Vaccinia virus Copenhagen]